MAWTKAKTAIVVGVSLLLAAGTATVAIKAQASRSVEDVFAHYTDTGYLNRARPGVLLRPTRYARQGDWINASGSRFLGRNRLFPWVLAAAYDFGPERMVLPPNLPGGRFDYLVTIDNQSQEALQAEIKRQFGLVGRVESREMDVLLLQKNLPEPALKEGSAGKDVSILTNPGKLTLVSFKMPMLANALAGYYFDAPVIDETGLTGSYDSDLHWNGRANNQNQEIERALKEQLGLELVRARRPVEMLVVEKTPN
jgi:uncharacterized protein (TIGR03435 family)